MLVQSRRREIRLQPESGGLMISLRNLDRTKIVPVPREVHLEKIRRFKEAQEKLEQRCKELGIPVPIMVM